MKQQSLTEHKQNSAIQPLLSLRPDAKCKHKMENVYVLCFLDCYF